MTKREWKAANTPGFRTSRVTVSMLCQAHKTAILNVHVLSPSRARRAEVMEHPVLKDFTSRYEGARYNRR
jgi:hypothetical protein